MNMFPELRPTYNINESYEWNFNKGPVFEGDLPLQRRVTPQVKLLDCVLNSPLGIPAGLLLNSRWVKLYAELGFDLLTYKTVRTQEHRSFPKPNCLLVNGRGQLSENQFSETLTALPNYQPKDIREVSITNSFGVPSLDPSEWQPDVEKSKSYLSKGLVLIVSVVGTFGNGEDFKSFANDFAHAATLAKEAGADIIELNFSCPNSPSAEGILYTDPEASSQISKTVKKVIQQTPLFLKIGYINNIHLMEKFLTANAPFIQGVVGINTIKMRVVEENGNPALPGQGREESGICGYAIQQCGIESAKRLVALRDKNKYDFVVIGVGGIMVPGDIEKYLDVGVDAVQSCTGAMWNPYLAYEYYKQTKSL